MANVIPFLWFDRRLAEAAIFSSSVFGDSALTDLAPRPDGEATMARFRLAGHELTGFVPTGQCRRC